MTVFDIALFIIGVAVGYAVWKDRKRIWCFLTKHDWEVEGGQDFLHLRGLPWFVCKRCGKRENTL